MSDCTITLLLAANTFDPQMLLRLSVAAVLGLVIGLEREKPHRAAGMRTHVLVALGSALFVTASLNAGATLDATTRVIQGVVQGIGFLGAGTILKLSDKAEVRGLTTAASVWLTAAIGVAAGLGDFWLAGIAAVLGWLALRPLKSIEDAAFPRQEQKASKKRPGTTAPTSAEDD
jgi:putative Mg2+ transporter-C (MgtC) family protein